jgi:hypothetical protein
MKTDTTSTTKTWYTPQHYAESKGFWLGIDRCHSLAEARQTVQRYKRTSPTPLRCRIIEYVATVRTIEES